jgi:uncharacterized Zn finger protein (UPF0148 family)
MKNQDQARAEHRAWEAVRAADQKLTEAVNARVAAGNAHLVHSLRDLTNFVPGFFPLKRGVYGENPDGKDADLKTAPLMSECYLYALFGKEDARTILAYLDNICRNAGISDGANHFHAELYAEREAAEEEEKLRRAGMAVRARQFLDAGCTFTRKPCPSCGTPKCRHPGLLRLAAEAAAQELEVVQGKLKETKIEARDCLSLRAVQRARADLRKRTTQLKKIIAAAKKLEN